jgi:AcrR family transcriptional regulator
MTSVARGRPRSPEADKAILQAAIDVLHSEGYARMSMESVAEAAGVGKTTVYRRYKDKDDLVTAALEQMTPVLEPPDSGDTRADLLLLLQRFQGSKEKIEDLRLMGTLWSEEQRNPELMRLFRERVIRPRRQMLLDILKRGKKRGELRDDVDPALVVEMMVGAHFARRFAGRPIPRDWAEQVVDQIWPALEKR